MNIQPTYVTYEQGKLLKKIDFDIPTIKFYYFNDKRHWHKDGEIGEGFNDEYWGDNTNLNWNKDGKLPFKPFSECVSAPEQWQVVEWLRVKHGIWISVKRDYHNGALLGFESMIDNEEGFIDCGAFDTPQEAYSAAFDYILKKLI